MFLNAIRPARRYLYFRYIMTYRNHKTQGRNMDLAEKVNGKGRMWATPGPYLRRSMLQNLARFVSHEALPEELIKENTFAEARSCASRGDEAEEVLAMGLAVKIREAEKAKKDKVNEDSDDDDDGNDGDDGEN